ncbi:MAG TPA: thermosome subunit alpha [archaeon]|jgi:thermosome|nr:thermosome subunit alpha [archaeon]HPV66460.1 thermosome subunit alpha [archaeon]HRS42705.1 thermosome subunit alpha [Candidatus Diapherotrites archaeon]
MGNESQNTVFLPEGSKRERGKDAQRMNIMVAKAVSNAVKSTLGPRGMDKMLVDELGNVTISNDGATILKEMAIEHPIGKMLVELAKNQDDEVGDGTTSAVVIAGGLVAKAENLLDENVHPSIIIKGYKMASEKAVEYFNEISEKVAINDKQELLDIAKTSMTGKASEYSSNLGNIVLEATLKISKSNKEIDRDQIKIEQKIGGSLSDTKLIDGIVLDKEIVHSEMPRSVKNAKILLLSSALEVKEPETEAKIQITSPDQLQAFIDEEEHYLKAMVDRIEATGANVVLCQKGIDDLAQHYLAKAGITAIRRVRQTDIERIAKATGGKIVSRIKDVTTKDLGTAEHVYDKKIAGDYMLFIEKCPNPGYVTILLRGTSEQVLAETERTLTDAIGAVISTIKTGKFVAAGGASEIEVALRLKNFAKTVGGREQLAIEAFADVLEIIPKTLAESAGLDAIDTIVFLRSKHQDPANKALGIDVVNGIVADMKKKKVIEPIAVKTQAVTSATEVAEMILRIDDIIAGQSNRPRTPPMGMGGMPGGMGEM